MPDVKRVPESDLDFESDLVFSLGGEPFTGVGYEESAVGLSEVSYRDGRQEGPARGWWPSGHLKAEAMYVQGAQHGISREFREDGQLSSETTYEYGIRTVARFYGVDGELESVDELDISSGTGRLLTRYRSEYNWGWPPDPHDL